jgi:hypothetical protein
VSFMIAGVVRSIGLPSASRVSRPSIAEDATHDLFTTLMRDGHRHQDRRQGQVLLLPALDRSADCARSST